MYEIENLVLMLPQEKPFGIFLSVFWLFFTLFYFSTTREYSKSKIKKENI